MPSAVYLDKYTHSLLSHNYIQNFHVVQLNILLCTIVSTVRCLDHKCLYNGNKALFSSWHARFGLICIA